MPEEQEPFIHEGRAPAATPLMSTVLQAPSLAKLSAVLRKGATVYRDIDRDGGAQVADEAARSTAWIMDSSARILEFLQQPSMNAIAVTVASSRENEGALLAQLATALMGSGNKKLRLMTEVRRAIEALS